MARSFGIVEAKVAEANFFLICLEDAGIDFFKARCFFSAFVSSARSITYAIQASIGDLPEFDRWYSEQQESLRATPLARFFNEARRLDHHVGINVVTGGEIKSDAAGEHISYHFVKTGTKSLPPDTDVVAACRQHLTALVAIVYACHNRFGGLIDPERYYRAEIFAARGLTIEDAEEDVFGFRGWTDSAGAPLAERWQIIRSSVAPCHINHLFHQYLGQELPGKSADSDT